MILLRTRIVLDCQRTRYVGFISFYIYRKFFWFVKGMSDLENVGENSGFSIIRLGKVGATQNFLYLYVFTYKVGVWEIRKLIQI